MAALRAGCRLAWATLLAFGLGCTTLANSQGIESVLAPGKLIQAHAKVEKIGRAHV